ncbi:winged helix DNA-binding domain-containing protein [Wenjunlia tyrosinilytica]|uniref:Winged helix DNA-binding domain-containing protein n=1 Tax=Wenjunlia tyrosinilytica TaxID=1544741 RepID=A0A917ZLG0_9ACTN|nr:winged helix DNA-binding domain-containing protein [Wenjunlia tyrosinilytica]GGO84126.1 hypothetical protein GCM10012280_14880 [Wenjunlia tyrosinilytica]
MTNKDETLGRRALNRALLERQMLLERRPVPAADVIEHLVGMQSQAPMSAYYALWSRIEGFHPDELAKLLTERQAVRIVLMRGTIHLVTADDCLKLRPLVQPCLDRAMRGGFGRGLAGVDLAELEAAGRALVEEVPRTPAEVGAVLRERWPDRSPADLSNAVRMLVPLVQVPPRAVWGRSGRALHTTAESWLGRPLVESPAAGEMVLRHLGAFGPATVKDTQVWSGLTGLRSVFEDLRPRLRTFRDEHGRELFDLPEAPRPAPDTPVPVRFLSEFDNMLLSYDDRTRIIAEEDRAKLFGVNGVISASILIDGFVAGTWRITRDRGAATLVVQPFVRLPSKDREALTEEGGRLLTFAAGDATGHDVRFEPPV